jgi:hypothetical protein
MEFKINEIKDTCVRDTCFCPILLSTPILLVTKKSGYVKTSCTFQFRTKNELVKINTVENLNWCFSLWHHLPQSWVFFYFSCAFCTTVSPSFFEQNLKLILDQINQWWQNRVGGGKLGSSRYCFHSSLRQKTFACAFLFVFLLWFFEWRDTRGNFCSNQT